MPPTSNTKKCYQILERVEWPSDLPGPNFWKPDYKLLGGLPNELKRELNRVTASGIRFYQKVKHLSAPMISGDTIDPDAIHALQCALDRQDELGNAIKLASEHQTESLIQWVQCRKKSHIGSMHAVVVAEEGELYDAANKEPWEVKLAKMTNEHVDYLRFIFRTVMARIDVVPAKDWNKEKITPTSRECIVSPGQMRGTWFPAAPPVLFWQIDSSLMENSTLKMRQAALALQHQGRVVSAARDKFPVTDQEHFPPVVQIATRALEVTVRSIDLLWIERQERLPEEEEQRLRVWLQQRKDAAADLRFALIEFQIPLDLYDYTVKIDNSAKLYVLRQGDYKEWGKLFLM